RSLTLHGLLSPDRLSIVDHQRITCVRSSVRARLSNMSTQSDLRVVSRLSTAMSQLAGVDLETLPDSSLLELARRGRQMACRLQSEEIRLVAAIDGRGASITEGLKSTTAWLRSQLRVGDSSTRVRCAKAVATMPAVGKAFAAGELSLEHVRVFARVVSD